MYFELTKIKQGNVFLLVTDDEEEFNDSISEIRKSFDRYISLTGEENENIDIIINTLVERKTKIEEDEVYTSYLYDTEFAEFTNLLLGSMVVNNVINEDFDRVVEDINNLQSIITAQASYIQTLEEGLSMSEEIYDDEDTPENEESTPDNSEKIKIQNESETSSVSELQKLLI